MVSLMRSKFRLINWVFVFFLVVIGVASHYRGFGVALCNSTDLMSVQKEFLFVGFDKGSCCVIGKLGAVESIKVYCRASEFSSYNSWPSWRKLGPIFEITIPVWLLLVLLILISLTHKFVLLIRSRNENDAVCVGCGYIRIGWVTDRCPECNLSNRVSPDE